MNKYQKELLYMYSILIFVGCLLGESIDFPSFYFSEKKNFLNQIFVKNGWAWTISLLLSLIYLRSFNRLKTLKSLKSLIGATLYWFLITQWTFGPSILERVYKRVGSCSLLHLKEFHLCYEGGGEWDGLDISGHCFLLLHSSLLIWEEIRNTFSMNLNNLKNFNSTMAIGMALMILLGLWSIMLLITVLYFHSIVEKALGTIFGFGFWTFEFLRKSR